MRSRKELSFLQKAMNPLVLPIIAGAPTAVKDAMQLLLRHVTFCDPELERHKYLHPLFALP